MLSDSLAGIEGVETQGLFGHRGASTSLPNGAPENTMLAFQKAHELGVLGVEFDVQLTKDGVAVVVHDDTLTRVTQGKDERFIDDVNLADLLAVDVGSWYSPECADARVPTLADVIQYLVANNMVANVEVKTLHENDDALTKKTIETIESIIEPDHDMFLYSSFSFHVLYKVRKLLPHAKIGMLIDATNDFNNDYEELRATAKALKCFSIHLNYQIILQMPELAHFIKQEGYRLYTYTVDEPLRAKELYELGVDAVFTNDPATLLKANDAE